MVMYIYTPLYACMNFSQSNHELIVQYKTSVNTLRTGDANLRFYITTVQEG